MALLLMCFVAADSHVSINLSEIAGKFSPLWCVDSSCGANRINRNMVGSLLYLSCWSRPDIAFAVSELSRFISAPAQSHFEAAKHLLRYLKGTRDLGLRYSKTSSGPPSSGLNILYGYVDSDWAGCPDTRRSTSGFVLMLNGATVSWKSKRQSVVALSTAEAEFVAASSMVQELTYTRRLLERLGFPQAEPTTIFEDNATCIKWAGGAVGGSDRAKHIDLREHYVHQAQDRNLLRLQPVAGVDNVADILTKPLLLVSCRATNPVQALDGSGVCWSGWSGWRPYLSLWA